MNPNEIPHIKQITPNQAVIASSRLMPRALLIVLALTRYFQLGIDQTQTKFATKLSAKSPSEIKSTTPPGSVKFGFFPKREISTKLPVTKVENQV